VNDLRIVKKEKIEYCQKCDFFSFVRAGVSKNNKYYRYKCKNPESLRKNGNYRIINKAKASKGIIPGWCKLEDYYK